MNAEFFGDSYDLVKRFFCQELKELGYKVWIDPMFPKNVPIEEQYQAGFFRFVGAQPRKPDHRPGKTAL